MEISTTLKSSVLIVHLFVVGIMLGVLGPSLPDLMCIYQAHMADMTDLLLALGLGGVSGQLVIVPLLKRVPLFLLLLALLLLSSCFYFLLPFVNIHAANLLASIASFSVGSSVNAVIFKFHKMLPGNHRALYLAFAALSFGSVLGPFTLAPFLSDGIITTAFVKQGTAKVQTNNSSSINISTSVPQISNSTSDTNNHKTNSERSCINFVSLLQYPYMSYGFLGLPISLMLILFHLKEKTDQEDDPYTRMKEDRIPYTRTDYVFISLMFLFLLHGQGLPIAFTALLPTFGNEGPPHMSLEILTWMTSLLWLTFTLGRVLPSVYPSWISQLQVLMVSLCGLTVGSALLCLSSHHVALLWVSTVLCGLCSAPSIPAGMAWARETVHVTPEVTAVLLGSVAVSSFSPYVCGMVINKFGISAFPYFFLGLDIFTLVVFAITVVIAKLK